LAKTTLGVVLVADVIVVVIFTMAFSLAQASLGGETGSAPEILVRLMLEVIASILAGAIVGGVLTLYLRFVKRELVVFAVVLVFATAAAAEALHFELLLSLLVAGFLVENVAPVRAEPLVETLHQMAVPVFVVFFAIAGAELHVREFGALWPLVLTVALLRMAAIAVGATAGGRLAGAEPQVTRYAWTGLVSQAGVALGLATIVADRLPLVGLAMQTLIVGVIAFNESVGPVLFRRGLDRAGEIVVR
jgi:Kef-type K+ transport system membrane component KefB